MTDLSSPPYRFGDLLALARRSWVAQMRDGLASAGFADYRRSDAAVVRLLHRGPLPIGRLGQALGITRQAARKLAAGLEGRGLATVARDRHDARQLNVTLTAAGDDYADAIRAVIDTLNRRVARRVPPGRLAAADAVLRAVLADEHTRALAALLDPPGERPDPPRAD
jgi:DNA-binding MarR family transcriptional regulator